MLSKKPRDKKLIIIIPALFLLLLLLNSFSAPLFRSFDTQPAITFEDREDLPKDEILRIAMLQLYLRSLFYYDGPITGKTSSELLEALSRFQKKLRKDLSLLQSVPQPISGFVSQLDFLALREKFWNQQPAIPLTQTYEFFIREQGIFAQGGWAQSKDTKSFPSGSSQMTCLWKTGTCLEIYKKADYRQTISTVIPNILTQYYKILSRSEHSFKAETVRDVPEELLNGREISWLTSPCQKAILKVDLDHMTIEKSIVNDPQDTSEFCQKARKTKNIFTSESKSILKDTRAIELDFGFNKYWSKSLLGQFFPKDSLQSHLFDWLAKDALKRAKERHQIP